MGSDDSRIIVQVAEAANIKGERWSYNVCGYSLFNINMDTLLQRVPKQGIDCHIGTIFMESLEILCNISLSSLSGKASYR